jgi:hypothetical protein
MFAPPKAPEGPTPVWIKSIRKDGKFKVDFCFSSRRMTKIITLDALNELKADSFYDVRSSFY